MFLAWAQFDQIGPQIVVQNINQWGEVLKMEQLSDESTVLIPTLLYITVKIYAFSLHAVSLLGICLNSLTS